MAANVPMMDSGTAAPGINVALRLRRKTKITITTRQTVSTRVNSTSWIEPRIDSEASKATSRSEEHTSELQSPCNLVCRLLLEKKKYTYYPERDREECRGRAPRVGLGGRQ